jgi:hypothetical protein
MWIELKVNKFIFLIIMGEESSIAREMTKKKNYSNQYTYLLEYNTFEAF